MTEQLALSLTGPSVGFVSAIFFCIGNALNTSKKILLQSTPFWGFSEPLARSLASQRAQYLVGAVLLVISFLLQIAAALASPIALAAIPPLLNTWPYLIFAVLIPTGLFSVVFSAHLYKSIIRKVIRENQARLVQRGKTKTSDENNS